MHVIFEVSKLHKLADKKGLDVVNKYMDDPLCNNDGNNKIYHDERTKDNEANQKSHCKHQCQSVFIIRVLNIAVDSLPRFKRFT